MVTNENLGSGKEKFGEWRQLLSSPFQSLDLGFSLWFLLQYLLERGNLSTRPSRKIPYRGGSLFSSRSMNDSFIRLPRKVAKMSSR
jgi:hypothetical protein